MTKRKTKKYNYSDRFMSEWMRLYKHDSKSKLTPEQKSKKLDIYFEKLNKEHQRDVRNIKRRAKKPVTYHGREGKPLVHKSKEGKKYITVRKSGGGVKRLYEGSKYKTNGKTKKLIL